MRPTRPGRTATVATTASAVALAGVLVVTGGAPGDDPRATTGDRPASAGPTYSPLPPPDPCALYLPSGDRVDLGLAAARALTGAAVVAADRGTARARRVLAGQVRRVLGLPPHRADRVAATLLGQVPASVGSAATPLSCSTERPDVDPERIGPTGLTPRAARLRRAFTRVFGPLPAGGFARGGVSTGHVDNSAHYEGRAIDVFFRPYDEAAERRAGWVFAQWLAAHADRYQVLSIIYRDRIWTTWASAVGWRPYDHPSGDRDNPVLRHLDHVHVAVHSGRPWQRR